MSRHVGNTHRVASRAAIRVKLSLLLYSSLCLQNLLHGHLLVHTDTELQLSLPLPVPLALLLDRCIRRNIRRQQWRSE